MLHLPMTHFLKHVETTSEPVNAKITNPISLSRLFPCGREMKKFFDSLNKNKKSTGLIITNEIDNPFVNLDNFMKYFEVPQNIINIELPQMFLTTKIKLQPHIVNLELECVSMIDMIDFSENISLQSIISDVSIVFIENYYGNGDPDEKLCIDISHLYQLEQICFIDCDKCKNSIDRIIAKIKLPYGCRIVYLDG